MTKKTNSRSSLGTALTIGAGVAVLTAATYILFGPNGKENRKKIKGWIGNMRTEVVEKMMQAKQLTKPAYDEIIDTVAEKYANAKNIDKVELKRTIADIRSHWKTISASTPAPIKKRTASLTKKRVPAKK